MTEEEVAEYFATLLGVCEEKAEEETPCEQTREHDNRNHRSHNQQQQKSKKILTPVCVCTGEEYSLESVIPDEISVETFTRHILGLPLTNEQRTSTSPPE